MRVNQIYLGDQFALYTNSELCCTFETNVMLWVNYMSTEKSLVEFLDERTGASYYFEE